MAKGRMIASIGIGEQFSFRKSGDPDFFYGKQITRSIVWHNNLIIYYLLTLNRTKMKKKNNSLPTRSSAMEVVKSCVNALNDEDFKTARSYVSDDMKFKGVLGPLNSADAYFSDMKRMRLKYEIKKAFVNGDDVCLLYDLIMFGVNFFGCGWYHVAGGKINSLRVEVFDPRPVLRLAGRK
jgi:SnoaL-like domain